MNYVGFGVVMCIILVGWTTHQYQTTLPKRYMYARRAAAPVASCNEGATVLHHSQSLDVKVKGVLEDVKRKLESSALTSQEALLLAENCSFTSGTTTAQVPFLFPRPSSQHYPETLSIYNVEAWRALRRTLVNRKQFSLCANGGSSTAGAKGTVGKQFYYEFVKYLNTTGVVAAENDSGAALQVDIVERGHGTRDSFHSALMAQSYFPPNLDILLWEFAINDYDMPHIHDPLVKRREVKNQLILWLDQVSRMQPRPPLVIFTYLWSTPFRMDSQGRVMNEAFEIQEKVAAEYDFVVGHVNLAAYVEELGWGQGMASKHILVDQHHPSALGHALMASLLLHLVIQDDDNQKQRPLRSLNSTIDHTISAKTPYQWACGNATEEQRLIQSRVAGKQPLASFTMELPKNDQVYPGMLVARSETNATITFGVVDTERKDRQESMALPCCKDDGDTQMLELVDPHRTHISMRAIQLGMSSSPKTRLKIYFDSKDVSANLMTAAADWDCLWSFRNTYHSGVGWIVMDRNVSSIRMCDTEPSCGQSLGLMSMVVY